MKIIKNYKTYNLEEISNTFEAEIRRGKMVEKFVGKLFKNYKQTTEKSYYDLEVVDENNQTLLVEVKADHSPATYDFGTIRMVLSKGMNRGKVDEGFLYELKKVDRFIYVRFNKEIYNKVDAIYIFDSKVLYTKIMQLEEERPDAIKKFKGDATRENQNNKNNYSTKEIHYIPVFKYDNNNNYIVNNYFKDALIKSIKSNFIFNYMITDEELADAK